MDQVEQTVALIEQALAITEELGDDNQRDNWLNILGYAHWLSRLQSLLVQCCSTCRLAYSRSGGISPRAGYHLCRWHRA